MVASVDSDGRFKLRWPRNTIHVNEVNIWQQKNSGAWAKVSSFTNNYYLDEANISLSNGNYEGAGSYRYKLEGCSSGTSCIFGPPTAAVTVAYPLPVLDAFYARNQAGYQVLDTQADYLITDESGFWLKASASNATHVEFTEENLDDIEYSASYSHGRSEERRVGKEC